MTLNGMRIGPCGVVIFFDWGLSGTPRRGTSRYQGWGGNDVNPVQL